MLRARGRLRHGQLVRQDRDEHQVVDAEHDLHHHQGDQRGPGRGVGGELQKGFHRAVGLSRLVNRMGPT